jgi:hypothetical protein
MQWSGKYQFVSDDPRKVTMKKKEVKRTSVGRALLPMIQGAQKSVRIISPYFVPGDAVTTGLTTAVSTGKEVGILTNSLVANDVAAVHGGYSRYRKPLLKGGVQLWELKPQGSAGNSSFFGSSGASLHTKAFSVDGEKLFVGSYNLDPRSTWLNCEQGVMVEDPVLAEQLDGLFKIHTNGEHAWRVTLVDGDLLGRRNRDVQVRSESVRLAEISGLDHPSRASGRPTLAHAFPQLDEGDVGTVNTYQAEARKLEVDDHVGRHREDDREHERVQPAMVLVDGSAVPDEQRADQAHGYEHDENRNRRMIPCRHDARVVVMSIISHNAASSSRAVADGTPGLRSRDRLGPDLLLEGGPGKAGVAATSSFR